MDWNWKDRRLLHLHILVLLTCAFACVGPGQALPTPSDDSDLSAAILNDLNEPVTTTNAAPNSTSAPDPPPAGADSSAAAGAAAPSRSVRQYMTGNTILDRVMSCPCTQDQLTSVGVAPVPYSSSNQPNPAIYRAPPYGPNAPGPGDIIATNLRSAGGTTGNVFGQLIRLIFGLPNLFLTVAKPLVVGTADSLAQTADATAGVTKQAAQSVPMAFRSTAQLLRTMLETLGDITGGLLHMISNLTNAVAAASTSVSGSLPFAFDIFGEFGGRASQAVAAGADFVSGTTDIVADGIVQAAKSTSNIFTGLVEGSAGFSTGLLEGIKSGVNDEPPPPGEGGYRNEREVVEPVPDSPGARPWRRKK